MAGRIQTCAVVAAAWTAACDPLPPAPDAGGPWTTAPALPGPRLEAAVAALGHRIAVYGGFDRSERDGLRLTPEVVVLDSIAGVWDRLIDAPVAWSHANLAVVGTTLYVLGGHDGIGFVARGEGYALDTAIPDATWREVYAMPAGLERGAAAVVVSPPHIFLLGGASTTEAVASCLDYDLTNNSWSQLPDLPAPRSHAAALRMQDGTLVIAGGLATLDATQPYGDVLVLPPGATQWEPRLGQMEVPRGGCASGAVLGQLVCAGGETGDAAVATTESYDPFGDVWTRHADLPAPRAGTRGAVAGGQLYVPGGAARLAFEPTTSVYVFSFLATIAP